MDISDRVVVLDYARKIADGPPDDVRISPDVAAYLGMAPARPHPNPPPLAGEGMGGG